MSSRRAEQWREAFLYASGVASILAFVGVRPTGVWVWVGGSACAVVVTAALRVKTHDFLMVDQAGPAEPGMGLLLAGVLTPLTFLWLVYGGAPGVPRARTDEWTWVWVLIASAGLSLLSARYLLWDLVLARRGIQRSARMIWAGIYLTAHFMAVTFCRVALSG